MSTTVLETSVQDTVVVLPAGVGEFTKFGADARKLVNMFFRHMGFVSVLMFLGDISAKQKDADISDPRLVLETMRCEFRCKVVLEFGTGELVSCFSFGEPTVAIIMWTNQAI